MRSEIEDLQTVASDVASERGRVRPWLSDVWMVVAVAAPAVFAVYTALHATDLAYHLRLGESIVLTGAIPEADTFTFTAQGRPWQDQQWLAQLVLFATHRLGGFEALLVLRATCVAAIASCLYSMCRSRGASARIAALMTLGSSVLAIPYLSLRPQLLGAVCFAVSTLIVGTQGRSPRRLWLVPLITIVWANIHGSFVLAPALITYVLITDLNVRRSPPRRSLTVLVLTAIATCATPWGAGVWTYAVRIMANSSIRAMINEWQPPSFETIFGVMFLTSTVAVMVWASRRTEPIPSWESLWVAGFTLLGFSAYRNVLWWAIAVPPMLVGRAGGVVESARVDRGSRPMNVIIIAAIALVGTLALPWWRPPTSLVVGTPTPTLMSGFERAVEPDDRAFVYQGWASWIELTRPDVRVFVDSRIELFDADTWQDYTRVMRGEDDWEAILNRYEVDAVMVTAEAAVVIDGLSRDPAWTTVAIEPAGALFVRG